MSAVVKLTPPIDEMVAEVARDAGLLWPLDRSVAVNPLVDRVDLGFADAVAGLGSRLGATPWPAAEHLAEAARRGLRVDLSALDAEGNGEPATRPATLLERAAGQGSELAESARRSIGWTLLEVTRRPPEKARTDEAADLLASGDGWAPASLELRARAAGLLADGGLEGLVARLSPWRPAELREELARQIARMPGWAAWARWCDGWAREPHPAAISLADLLAVSLALDLAGLELSGAAASAPEPMAPASPEEGMRRLLALEAAVHDDLLGRLRCEAEASAAPALQLVACIDVRSEPLRRALEQDPEVETFGFAGFFGIPAAVRPDDEREAHDALPVIVAPSVEIVGGRGRGEAADARISAEGVFAELTHEPSAMFALAEAAGWLGAPWMLARSLLPASHRARRADAGPWALEPGSAERGLAADIAEGALRGMGLTGPFAPEVLLVGHGATSTANTHFATLDCGACAGHAGAPNAAALASLLEDPELRAELGRRGIEIPASTRFLAGEHDTTRERVAVFGELSEANAERLAAATDAVATWRAGLPADKVAKARRRLERRARDWAEVRPEWGLADHGAFVVAPRSSIRGADLEGRCFLHSYDPGADEDGSILAGILAGPGTVGHWINASYYFSTTAPGLLGAGDKTLLNPVGDFGAISGDDPDLVIGLPWQSVAEDDRPVHLPVRLLVAVEAPLERIEAAVRSEASTAALVEGGWVLLAGRAGPEEAWQRWQPGAGWVAS